MRKINILDCTLRDGGCVNNFDFGMDKMHKIKTALEDANIDIIECGYLDGDNGSIEGRTMFYDDICLENFLNNKNPRVTYVAMIDLYKFDVNKIQPCNQKNIDGIRIAFHKKDMKDAINAGKQIIEKGYKFYLQPMVVMNYTENELLNMVRLVNVEIPECEAFYIVDSFGQMRPKDLDKIFPIINRDLSSKIKIGLHSHNNLQLSYANAIQLTSMECKRDIIIDSSIMGMGKGAGNLNTELFAEHMNRLFNTNYNSRPLLHVIDNVIRNIYSTFSWGYSPAYFLSALEGCSPTYASYFYDKYMMSIEDIGNILALVSEEKKLSFDKKYADYLYLDYKENYYDDSNSLKTICNIIRDRELLLIAPGRSLKDKMGLLDNINKKYVIISVNTCIAQNADYIFTTKKNVYEEAVKKDRKIIMTSNIQNVVVNDEIIIDYKKWSMEDDEVINNTLLLFLRVIKGIKVKKISLMGFDGFDVDISENYVLEEYEKPFSKSEIKKNNEYMKAYLKELSENTKIEFLTKSKYEFEPNMEERDLYYES